MPMTKIADEFASVEADGIDARSADIHVRALRLIAERGGDPTDLDTYVAAVEAVDDRGPVGVAEDIDPMNAVAFVRGNAIDHLAWQRLAADGITDPTEGDYIAACHAAETDLAELGAG
jgi:hypothetical protein